MLAPRGPEREEPLLAAFELLRVELACPHRLLDSTLRGVQRHQRLVERLHDPVEQARHIRGLALQPPEQARELRHRRIGPRQHVLRVADVGHDLLRPHHCRALFSQFGLLARHRVELRQFLDRGAQIVGLAGGGLDLGPMAGKGLFAVTPAPPCRRHLPSGRAMATEGVQQVPVRRRVDQGPLVVLPVDFHQRAANLADQRDAGRLVVDEDPRPPVGRLHAAQDHVALMVDIVLGKQRTDGMAWRQVEHRRHLPLRRTLAHQRGIAARAKRQRQ